MSHLHKIIIVSLPILGFLGTVEYMSRAIPNEYKFKIDQLTSNCLDFQTIILGSSHALYGIDPDHLDNSFNLAYLSQQIEVDAHLIKKLTKSCDQIRNVVLPISLFTFSGNLREGKEHWRSIYYYVYYKLRNKIPLKNRWFVTSLEMPKLLSRIWSHLQNRSKLKVSKKGYGLHYDNVEQRDLNLTGIEAAKRHSKIDEKNFDLNLDHLEKIVAYCKTNNLRLFLLTTPTWETYRNNIDQEIYTKMQKTINTIIEKNPDVQYFNFFSNEKFTKGDFRDADHLNRQGAKKLSIILDQTIKGAE